MIHPELAEGKHKRIMKKEDIQVLFRSFEDATCMVNQVERLSTNMMKRKMGMPQTRPLIIRNETSSDI